MKLEKKIAIKEEILEQLRTRVDGIEYAIPLEKLQADITELKSKLEAEKKVPWIWIGTDPVANVKEYCREHNINIRGLETAIFQARKQHKKETYYKDNFIVFIEKES